ncbi:hypothetical protein C8R47DRAFT_786050 [Mycena vitilis]|nr:hypothetical protein C8R47DRAFT_786050 [Mycena vitilis]
MPAHRWRLRIGYTSGYASVESQHIIVGCPPIGGGYTSVTHLVTHRSSPSTSSLDARPSVEVTHQFSTAHGKRVGPTPKPSTVSPKSATQAQSVLSHLFPAALAKGSSLTRLCAEQARAQSRRTSPAHSTLLSLLFPRCAVSRKHLLLSRFPICFGDSGTMSKFCNFQKQILIPAADSHVTDSHNGRPLSPSMNLNCILRSISPNPNISAILHSHTPISSKTEIIDYTSEASVSAGAAELDILELRFESFSSSPLPYLRIRRHQIEFPAGHLPTDLTLYPLGICLSSNVLGW